MRSATRASRRAGCTKVCTSEAVNRPRGVHRDIFFLAIGLVFSDSDRWLSFLNALAATATVPLIAILARRLQLSTRIAVLAAGLAAVMPPLVVWSAVLGPENVQTPLLLTALVLAADPRRRPSSAIWSGVTFGLAILMRPESIVYLPVVALVVVPASWRTVAWRTIVVAAVAIVLCLPWLVRNQLQVGSVGLSSVGGVNFYFAHRESGYGYDSFDTSPLAGLDEASMSARGYRLGLENLRDKPTRILGDMVEGTKQLYAPPGYAASYSSRAFAKHPPFAPSVSDRLLSIVGSTR